MAHSTKPCPYCFQEVDSRTRKCPHCLSAQGTLVVLIGLIFLLCGVIAAGVIYVVQDPLMLSNIRSNSVESRTDLVKKIEVVKSELVFGQLKDGLTVGAIGMFKNNTDVSVYISTMEIQYYDASGKLIDVAKENYFGVIIAPRGEAAFKISGLADQPKDSYASYKLFVRAVRNYSTYD